MLFHGEVFFLYFYFASRYYCRWNRAGDAFCLRRWWTPPINTIKYVYIKEKEKKKERIRKKSLIVALDLNGQRMDRSQSLRPELLLLLLAEYCCCARPFDRAIIISQLSAPFIVGPSCWSARRAGSKAISLCHHEPSSSSQPYTYTVRTSIT